MRRGFTLIELLVVIGIIAVLAGILFPVFAQAKARAQSASAVSNVRQLVMATLLYAQSSDDRPPLVTEGPLGAGVVGGYTLVERFGANQAGRFNPSSGSLYPYAKNTGIYGSPLDPSVAVSHQSFAFNGCLVTFPPARGLMATLPISYSPQPSQQFLFAEEQSGKEGTNDGFFHPLYDTLAGWHSGRNAMGFVDGHAATTLVEGRYPTFVDASDSPCWPNDPW